MSYSIIETLWVNWNSYYYYFLVNNSFKKNFDTISIENKKIVKTLLLFFHKFFKKNY